MDMDAMNPNAALNTPFPSNPLVRTYAMGPDDFGLGGQPTLSAGPDLSSRRSTPQFLAKTPLEILQEKHDSLWLDYREALKESTRLVQHIGTLTAAHQELHEKYDHLRTKYFELFHDMQDPMLQPPSMLKPSATQGIPSISPSDSASQKTGSASSLSTTPTLIEQPVERPREYPESILWNYEDIFRCSQITISPHNKSRPPVHRCLRTSGGSIISDSQWIDIRSCAAEIVRMILHPLVEHSSPDHTTFRKKYFKDKWRTKWNEAVARIEAQKPLLQWCSFHWKAELVLGHILDSPNGKVNKADKSSEARTISPPPPLPSPPSPPPPLPLLSPSPRSLVLLPPPGHHPPESNLVVPAPQAPLPSPVSPTPENASMGPAASKHKIQVTSPDARGRKRRCIKESAAAVPSIVVSSAMDAGTSMIDVSGITVTASYEALREIIMGDANFQRVPHVLELLEALRLHSSSTPPASPELQEFIAGIEQADPNSPDVDEDNTNSSWGHYHFRNGAIRFDNLTWDQIANTETAYRLLAATIKTCRIARHLCFKRNITANSVVAEMYFDTIVQSLWKHWETSLDVSSQLPCPDTTTQTVSYLPELKKLHVPQLRALVEKLKVVIPKKKGKAVRKDDYLMALASLSPTRIDAGIKDLGELLPKDKDLMLH